MNFHISIKPAVDAATEVTKVLKEQLGKKKNVLFLLAGGSAGAVYEELAKHLNELPNLHQLVMCMGDERFDIDPNHAASNWKQFVSMKFFTVAKEKGAHFFRILQGNSIEETAADFSDFLQGCLDQEYFILSLQGIGKDGHTAGILPCEAEKFQKLFGTANLSCWHNDIDHNFPNRVTMTPSMMDKVHCLISYVAGAEKAEILKKVTSLAAKYPQQEWVENVHNYPALLFCRKNATIFSDQQIS